MSAHVAPQHIHNRAMRRWFNRHGVVSYNRDHEWHVEEAGPTVLGWYWDGILTKKPLTEIVIRDGRAVAVR